MINGNIANAQLNNIQLVPFMIIPKQKPKIVNIGGFLWIISISFLGYLGNQCPLSQKLNLFEIRG